MFIDVMNPLRNVFVNVFVYYRIGVSAVMAASSARSRDNNNTTCYNGGAEDMGREKMPIGDALVLFKCPTFLINL